MGFTTRTLARWAVVFGLVTQVRGSGEGLAAGTENKVEFEPLTIGLTWHDAYDLLPHSFETMSGEVCRIYSELGVAVSWERGEADGVESMDRDPLRINVVLLPSSSSSWGLQEAAMGVATHRKGSKGSVYVFFPELLGALSMDSQLSQLQKLRGMRDLGIAMARVVAHEVVHVLAPYHPHTKGGLMKSQLSRRFLTGRRSKVHLDDASAQVLRAEIQARAGSALSASGIDPIEVIAAMEGPVAEAAPYISIHESGKMR